MKNRIIVSSILTIALCLSMIAGSTFALFTSNSQVDVAVTSGEVKVVATADAASLKVGSTLGTPIGGAEIKTVDGIQTIEITNFVPGDYVSFDINVENESSVAIKYRTVLSVTEEADTALFAALDVRFGKDAAKYDGKTQSSAWVNLAPTNHPEKVTVTVSFPDAENNNDFMGKTCTISYKVEAVQGNVDVVDDVADLDKTLLDGGDVDLITDVTVDATVTKANSGYKGVTGVSVRGGEFNGNGNTITVKNANGTWDSAVHVTSGTIKNVKIDSGFRGIFVGSNTNGEHVYLENVIIDGPVYTISCDQGSGQGLTATGCTFNGWTSYAATIGDVKFVNCNFGEGSGYAFCRPYAETVFEGCNFEDGFSMDPRAGVTFINCYYNGVLITDANVDDLVYQNLSNVTISNSNN